MNYKRFLLCLLTTGYAFASSASFAFQELQPPPEYKQVSKELVETLEKIHYNRPRIDDTISAKAFDYYINALDPRKASFYKATLMSFLNTSTN